VAAAQFPISVRIARNATANIKSDGQYEHLQARQVPMLFQLAVYSLGAARILEAYLSTSIYCTCSELWRHNFSYIYVERSSAEA
jgi:hypothetical protein